MKQMKILGLAALAAGLLAVPAQAAGPAVVDVQVEGATGAVVPTQAVTTTTTAVVKDGDADHACTGTSAIGALETATSGDWSGTWFDGFGYSVERVRTQAASFSSGTYYAFYLNGRFSNEGACGTELQAGDDVLFYVACAGAESGCFRGEPLLATAPRTVKPGAAFTVSVQEATTTYDANGAGTTSLSPARGASVEGRTTGADGRADVTLAERGERVLAITKGDRPPERVRVCVTDGADGFCGTTAPGHPAPPQPAAPARPVDPTVRGRILNVREGASYARRRAPRLLRGTVPASGQGVERVRLRLTGACRAFDPRRERLVRNRRCSAAGGRWFTIGDRADWQYQLPVALPRGRWVLDLEVRDRSGRVSRLERGNTRVVFRVR